MIERLRQGFASLRGQRGDPPWLGSIGISAAVHVGLVFVLAALLTSGSKHAGDAALIGNWAEVENVVLDLEEVPRPTRQTASNHQNGGRTSGQALALNHTLTTNNVRVTREAASFPESPLDDPEFVQALGEHVRSRSRGKGTGNGSGDGSGAGGQSSLGFFGAAEPGKSYAFVLDGSRSMNYPHDGEWKSRMKLLKAELVRSIGKLGPDNRFFIIFFNSEPRPMPSRRLEPAIPQSQKRFLQWAIEQKADGETKPASALRLALKLKPDVIYFLTDGQFEPKFRRILMKIRQDRTVIHTYAMGNDDSEKVLRELAAANGGKYHYIP